jgi:hypothetical protein
MESLYINPNTITPTSSESTIELRLDVYFDNTQVQPLTPLMKEIINFQLEERALFTNMDFYTSRLN